MGSKLWTPPKLWTPKRNARGEEWAPEWHPSTKPHSDPRIEQELSDREQIVVAWGPNITKMWLGRRGNFRPRKRYRDWRDLPLMAGGGRQYYRNYQVPAGATMMADQTAITGTAEALLWPYNYTAIPAQILEPGAQIQIFAYGVATTPGSAATTMTVNPRWGTTTSGVSLGISNTSATVVISQTAVPWFLTFIATVRTTSIVATSSTVKGGGTIAGITMGSSATVPATLVMGGAAATVDTVSAEALVFGTTLGGSASWTMTTEGVSFEVIN